MRDLDEHEAQAAIGSIKKRKTWMQNKRLVRDMKTDRQSRMRPSGKKKLSIEKLKLITRYGRCGEKGHWHKECPNEEKSRGAAPSGFTFSNAFSATTLATLDGGGVQRALSSVIPSFTFLTLFRKS